jgi:hypothetical protein
MLSSEELHPLYIRLRQHQTSDEGSRTTLGCTCSPLPQHDACVGDLNDQVGFVDSSWSNGGESKTLMWSIDSGRIMDIVRRV